MLLKEIFSNKKKLFREVLAKKLLNQTTYEKSYIRRVLSTSEPIVCLDNWRYFFNKIKKVVRRNKFVFNEPKKTKGYGRTVVTKLKKKWITPYDRRIIKTKLLGCLGHSFYTTTFLYKNRKVKLMRFKQPICYMISLNFIDSFLKGLKTLIKGQVKTLSKKKHLDTLIILEVLKGGFSCYSYGFRGFLTTVDFEYIVREWKKEIRQLIRKKVNFFMLKSLVKSQKFHWSIAFPPRLKFSIETLSQTYRFRKNNYRLSRRKRTKISTKMLPRLTFCPICIKSFSRWYISRSKREIRLLEERQKTFYQEKIRRFYSDMKLLASLRNAIESIDKEDSTVDEEKD